MTGNQTHRVTGYITRSRSVAPAGEPRTYEPGDLISPTERELRNYAHILEALEGADESEADAEPSVEDASEPDDDAEPVEDGEDEPDEPEESETPDEPEQTVTDFPFAVEQIENAEYPRLRTMASDVDGVNGRAGEDEIRQGLLEKARGN